METMSNEAQIRELIERWAKAVCDRDIKAILAHHSRDIVMYDVPGPFQSVGLDAYRKTWETFFAWSQDLAVFDIQDLRIAAGEGVAFCFAAMKCAGRDQHGAEEELDFRLTVGLKKVDNKWAIIHEHHSIPAT